MAIRRLVVLHSGAVDNRDAASIATAGTDEFAFYSPEFATSLTAQGYATKLQAVFGENHLTTRQDAVAWYRSTVHQDRATARAEMDSTVEFTAADETYLQRGGLALHTPYTQHRTIDLAKRDGSWVITGIRKTALEKPAPRPS